MLPRLAQVVADTLRLDPAAVAGTTSPGTCPAWDSLGHLNLIAALEQAFGVTFSMEEILSMQDVDAIERVLRSKSRPPLP